MNYDKKLYEVIADIGECLNGEFHITETTDKHPVEGERSFRVYHKKGYCFDISKEVETESEDGTIEYSYCFYSEWDGFEKLSIKELIKLFEK